MSYSYRKARMGSIRVARKPGHVANAATRAIVAVAAKMLGVIGRDAVKLAGDLIVKAPMPPESQ